MTADLSSQTPNGRKSTGLVDGFLRRNGEGGLTDRGERWLKIGKNLGAIAAAGALIFGLVPREVGSAEVTPDQGESITSVIERGVEKTGVEGVNDSAIAHEAADVANWSPGAVNPEEPLRVSIYKSPILGVFGQESVDVSKPK